MSRCICRGRLQGGPYQLYLSEFDDKFTRLFHRACLCSIEHSRAKSQFAGRNRTRGMLQDFNRVLAELDTWKMALFVQYPLKRLCLWLILPILRVFQVGMGSKGSIEHCEPGRLQEIVYNGVLA